MKNIFLLLLLSGVLTGCGDDIASVNGTDVSADEFNAYLEFKRIHIRDDKHKRVVLEQYLEREGLSQAVAESNGFDADKAKIELDEFRRQMNVSRYFEDFMNKAVTDEKIQNYYSTNKDKYNEHKAHVAHILIRLNRDAPENERKSKLTTANDLYSKIKSGKTFEKMAEDASEDRISAKKGGDLGWLKKGAIDAKFSEKVFSMKKDEVSEPFETSFGFHIIKLIEEPTVVSKPFEAVKGDIRYMLREQVKAAEVERLKEEIDISIAEDSWFNRMWHKIF